MTQVVIDKDIGRGTYAVGGIGEHGMTVPVRADLPFPGRLDGLDIEGGVVPDGKGIHLAVLDCGHYSQFFEPQFFKGIYLHLSRFQLDSELFGLLIKLGIFFLKFPKLQRLVNAPDSQNDGQDSD